MVVSRSVLKQIILAFDCQVPFSSETFYPIWLELMEEMLLEIQIRNYIALNDSDGLQTLLANHSDVYLTSAGELLLEAIASIGGCTKCPVITGQCECSTLDSDGLIVTLLEDKRFDPMYRNGQPLIQAVDQNNSQLVDTLLDRDDLEPGAQDNAALKLAKKKGYTNIVSRLADDVRTHYIPD